MRGTFANVRLRNQLAPGTEGGFTLHLPDGEQTTIFDAADALRRPRASPLVVLAGKEYGVGLRHATGRPRARRCSGVRAVIAESYERIHRSNLIGMGVLPLQFAEGETAASLGLTGTSASPSPARGPSTTASCPKTVTVSAPPTEARPPSSRRGRAHRHPDGGRVLPARGILPYVLRQLAG